MSRSPEAAEQAVCVTAIVYPPSGRRQLPLLIVNRCPWCGPGTHVHRGQGGVRRAGCGRGDYVIVVAVAKSVRAA